MKAIEGILASLRERGVHVWAIGDQIHIRGPSHPDNAADLDKLKARKQEALEHLTHRASPPSASVNRPAHVPLSISQRIWFRPHAPAGVSIEARRTPATFQLLGPLDIPTMQEAIAELIKRHEILRTRYAWDGVQRTQKVLSKGYAPLAIVNPEKLRPDDRVPRIAEILGPAFIEEPDHAVGESMAAWIFRFASQNHMLALLVDHIALDNQSMTIIVGDLFQIYFNLLDNSNQQLPPLKVQYADYVLSSQRTQGAERLERNAETWREKIGSLRALDLRIASGPRLQPATARAIERIEPDEITKTVYSFAQTQGVTTSVVLISVFNLLFSHWTGDQELMTAFVVDAPAKAARRRRLLHPHRATDHRPSGESNRQGVDRPSAERLSRRHRPPAHP